MSLLQAKDDFEILAPKAVHIQKTYRGMKGRAQFKRWRQVSDKLGGMVEGLKKLHLRRPFMKLKENVKAQNLASQARQCAAIHIQVGR